MTTSTRLLTVQQLHEQWGIAEATFYSWRKQGRGPRSFKVGGRVVYDAAEVDAWLEEQKAATERGGAA